MNRYSLTSILFFLLFCCSFGQQPGTSGTLMVAAEPTSDHQRDSLEASVILLQNRHNLIPLTGLETFSIRWESFGLGKENAFSGTLEKYSPLSTSQLSENSGNIFILALRTDEYSPVNPDYQAFEKQAREVAGKSRIIAVLFGDEMLLTKLDYFRQADVVICVPQDDEISQSLAAQLIFGGIGAGGRLDKDIEPYFRKGDGLTSQGNLRLRYSPPAWAGLDAQILEDSFATIINEGIAAHAYPGAQVLVARQGHIVFHKAYGFHTYDSLQPVLTSDLYDFASVTKVTTALPALMKLYGEGRFDLDAPLKDQLRSFRKSPLGQVTFRELLAHYGQLPPGIVFWRQAKNENGEWKKKSFRNRQSRRYPIQITDSLFLFKNYEKMIFTGIRDLPLRTERSYVYSDLSFILYPKIVEKLTGMPLEDYLDLTFYKPLGAGTLTYNPLNRFPVSRIIPTERDTFFRMTQVRGTVHDETAAMMKGISGHAGLFGSANDLAKLIQLYLNEGHYGGRRFLYTDAIREFTRCQYCSEGNRRGLGFDKPMIEYDPEESYVAKDASPDSFGHSGFTGTFFWADPAHDLIVIFLSNRVYPYRSSRGLYDLKIRQRIHQSVYDALTD